MDSVSMLSSRLKRQYRSAVSNSFFLLDSINAISAYSGGPDVPDTPDTPDTPAPGPGSLRIVKLGTGTEIPLFGTAFEVVGSNGDTIVIPQAEPRNYTVYERSAPKSHLLCKNDAQNVTVVQDRRPR